MKKLLCSLLIGVCSLWLMVSSALAFNVTLAWDANTEPDLAHYNVYVSLVSGQYEDEPWEVPLDGYLGFTIPDTFPDGIIHYFVVTAVNLEGQESGYSNEVNWSSLIAPEFYGDEDTSGGCYIGTVRP